MAEIITYDEMMKREGGASKPKKDPTIVEMGEVAPKLFDADADELPEITSQTAIPAYQRMGTDFKLLFTSKPWEKARIIAKSFPERVEVLQDIKTKEPIIKLDDNHFVVNKKGVSQQDFNDFIAETGAYVIPTVLSGGTSIFVRFGLGLITYSAAETAREFATSLFGGKSKEDLETKGPVDVGKVGGVGLLGATTEAFAPPVLKIGGRALRKLWQGGKGVSTAAIDKVINAAASGDDDALRQAVQSLKPATVAAGDIPLTLGQQTGSRSAQETEAMMREGTGSYGARANTIMRSADARQMAAIERKAGEVQADVGAGTGFSPDAPYQVGAHLQSSIIQREAAERATAEAEQLAIKEMLRRGEPSLIPNYIMHSGIERALAIPSERAIRANMLNLMPDASQVLNQLRRVRRYLRQGKASQTNYAFVHDFSRSLNKRITTVNADPLRAEEGALLLEIKSRLTETIDNALTKGLIHGDPATISAVKAGNKTWSEYMKRYFQRPPGRFGQVDLAGRNLMKILGDESPEKVTGFFVNVTRGAPRKETGDLFRRVQEIFGKESIEIQLIKDAVIYRMFTNATQKGKAEITRTAIVKNYFDFFNKSKSLADTMFTAQERDSIRKFIGQVSRTIPAEVVMNPSGSGHVVARLLHDMGSGGLVARITQLADGVPMIGNYGGAGYAKTLAYTRRLSSAPWGGMIVAGSEKDRDSPAQRAVRGTAGAVEELIP